MKACSSTAPFLRLLPIVRERCVCRFPVGSSGSGRTLAQAPSIVVDEEGVPLGRCASEKTDRFLARLYEERNLLKLTPKIASISVLLLGAAGCLSQAATVTISPGMNILSEVSNNPAGTTFVIEPGTYRLTTPIVPKTGDVFTGQTACAPPKTACPAILSGSKLLTTFEKSGSYYYVTGQTQQGVTISDVHCNPGYLGCIYPEDLFFDGKPLVHVIALSDVAAGKWYFDYSANIIYFYDNPSGHTVETSYVPTAFEADGVNNVTVEQLTIKEFASPVTLGALGITGGSSPTSGANWTIKNNEVELNHGDGIRVNFGWQILNNYLYDNGDLGVGGGMGSIGNSQPSHVVVQGNEIAFNNYAQVKPVFGAGGAKLESQEGLVFKGNYVHDNTGDGLHLDTNLLNTLVDGNTVVNNTEQGLFEEISYAATIRNNIVQGNGYIYPNNSNWLYAAQILSSESQGVQAYCNSVQVSAEGGNGINIIAQVRPGYTSANNYFHHNTVVFLGESGNTGGANADPGDTTFYTTNKFDYNTYHLPSVSRATFAWNKAMNGFSGFQSGGEDKHGSADTYMSITPPTVAITSPADQSNVSGNVAMTGTAKDSSGVISKVEFYADWTLEATTSAADFTFTWNTSNVSAGQHTIAMMAYGPDGLRACNAVTVNVE